MKGKYMGTVRSRVEGQVVIPKGSADLFHIEPGETLLLLADINQGIAIVKNDAYLNFAQEVFRAQEKPEEPEG